jgi:hypothetical protein
VPRRAGPARLVAALVLLAPYLPGPWARLTGKRAAGPCFAIGVSAE